jgi:putative glutamine amidotransferase
VQDIESLVQGGVKHEQGMPHTRHSHSIQIAEDSVLAKLDSVQSSDATIRVNSSHHQAIGSVGRDLKATAWAKDGIIECIEDSRKGRFAVGVQWHPEMTRGIDRLSGEIFEHFVQSCMGQRPITISAP